MLRSVMFNVLTLATVARSTPADSSPIKYHFNIIDTFESQRLTELGGNSCCNLWPEITSSLVNFVNLLPPCLFYVFVFTFIRLD